MNLLMTLFPQPPQDARVPPLSKKGMRSRRCKLVNLMVGLFALVALGWMIIPRVVFKRHAEFIEDAMASGREIGIALHKFQATYRRFPDATTIEMVAKRTGNLLPLGSKSSNAYLRQLFAADPSLQETVFRASILGADPDGRIDGNHVLEKGECGFSYVIGPSSSDWNQPFLVAPLIPGTDRFDPKPFNGAAIVVRVDGSVQMLKMNKSGHVVDQSSRNILDPSNPIWKGNPPVIAWPE